MTEPRDRGFLRDNALTLFFLAIFLLCLVVQALVGRADFNHEQIAHQDEAISLGRYVTSSAFWVDVMENWQSEYLQFTLFIIGTVWLAVIVLFVVVGIVIFGIALDGVVDDTPPDFDVR